MKTILNICILSFLAAGSVVAQNITPSELLERGEFGEQGYTPRNLASLVGSSSIIIKGRFQRHLGTEEFFGFGRSRDDVMTMFRLSEEDTDKLAVSLSRYELVVQEVFLGSEDLVGTTITLTMNEPPLIENKFINLTDERLFFLAANPDDESFAVMGPASIQISRNGVYSYDSLTPNQEEFEGRTLEFMLTPQVEAFEEEVRREIELQY